MTGIVRFTLTEHPALEGFVVREAVVREALSRPWSATLLLASTHGAPVDLDLRAMVGQRAVLLVDREDTRRFPGVIAAASTRLDAGAQVVSLTLVPRLWKASRSRRSRVFVDQSLPEIVRAVMGENGLLDHHDFRGARPYAKRPHVAQYEETDLDFLHRVCEREGVFYVVDTDRAGLDRVSFHDDIAQRPADDLHALDAGHGGEVPDWAEHAALTPRAVAVRGYQQAARQVVMNRRLAPVLADRWTVAESGLQSFYGDNVATEEEAARAAALRATELSAEHHTYAGRTHAPGIRAGGFFAVRRHPFEACNGEFYAVEVTHTFRAASGSAGAAVEYYNEVRARRRGDPWAPPRVTPRPAMPAVVPAVVEGPADQGASPIDGAGHYRLVFAFDTAVGTYPFPSGPVPIATDFGGTAFGEHRPLHRGTHVLVAHLHDDPDRPVIVRAFMPSPLQHPTTHGVTVTRSRITVEYDDGAPAWTPEPADSRKKSVRNS